MLPVLIFDTNADERQHILELLARFSSRNQRLSVLANTDSLAEASRCLDLEQGIVLLIIGVGNLSSELCDALALESAANRINRDSYSLFWLHHSQILPDLAAQCLHPAGFVIPPPDALRFEQILDRICQDYERLASSPEQNLLVLQCGGSMHRLPVAEILYIEAFDKKLNIWTRRQCLSVYESIANAENNLGDRFFRCHRSYLVNYSHIKSANYSAMEITLTDGMTIPLSRSAKEKLKTRMLKEGVANEC